MYQNLLITKTNINSRLLLVLLVPAAIFVCLIIKLITLSNISNFKKHSIDDLQIRSPIFDRNGIMLASNLQTFSAYVNPKKIKDIRCFAQKMKKLNFDGIYEKLNKNKEKDFLWVLRKISPNDKTKIEVAGVSEISFIEDQKRILPHGNLFSHIIGQVSEDGACVSGVERKYNELLLNDVAGLRLTLDTRVQYYVREALIEGIAMHSAKSGAGIVMDVNNGELLSIVSYPDFNPNNIRVSDKEKLFNGATYGAYEMGSSFKLFTIASAIDAKIISDTDIIDISTPLKVGKFTIGDYRGGKGRPLSVEEILMYSSNIGVAKIAMSMGKNLQYNYLQKFGLLSNMEANVPDIASPIIGPWSEVKAITASYGHGIAVTPLHLVRAVSSVVNGGFLCNPSIIYGQKNCSSRVLKHQTSIIMRKLMRLAVEKGSVSRADVGGYNVAAKSGTAEKVINGKYDKELNLASTVAVFPINDPRYVVLIIIDSPHKNTINKGFRTGGMVAAPVVAQIIKKIAPILNVVPAKTQKANTNEQVGYSNNNYRLISSR